MNRTSVDAELLDKIVRAANDAGRKGRRIHSVEVVYGNAADTPAWIFVEDDGPRLATESWR